MGEENFEEKFEKKSTKKVGIIIGIVVVILVALVVAGVIYISISRKPEKIFNKAISETFKMNENDKKTSGKIELELSASYEGSGQKIQQMNAALGLIKLRKASLLDVFEP